MIYVVVTFLRTPDYFITAKKNFDLCVKQESRLRSLQAGFSSLPTTAASCQSNMGFSTKRAESSNCTAYLETPTKCSKCPLGGSPSPAESLAPAGALEGAPAQSRALPTARTRAQAAGKMDAACAQLGCPARISSDLRSSFVGRKSNKRPAYGGGQGKVISIRGGSLRSQANTDKLCNTGGAATGVIYPSREPVSPGFAGSPFAAPAQSPFSFC